MCKPTEVMRFRQVPIRAEFRSSPLTFPVRRYVRLSARRCQDLRTGEILTVSANMPVDLVLDPFTRSYIETMLWSSTHFAGDDDPNGESFARLGYTVDHFSREALGKILADCARFQSEHGERIARDYEGTAQYTPDEYAGSDFWLTRNGHGAGFWDGDWSDGGRELTDSSHAYGEQDLCLGDDGYLYLSP